MSVYDKHMVFYPLSIFMLVGIREILFISVPLGLFYFQRLSGDGCQVGLNMEYAKQPRPKGLDYEVVANAGHSWYAG